MVRAQARQYRACAGEHRETCGARMATQLPPSRMGATVQGKNHARLWCCRRDISLCQVGFPRGCLHQTPSARTQRRLIATANLGPRIHAHTPHHAFRHETQTRGPGADAIGRPYYAVDLLPQRERVQEVAPTHARDFELGRHI